MRDTCTSHFEPKKLNRVGRRGQKQPKWGYLWRYGFHDLLFDKQVANLSWDSELDTGQGKDFLFLFDLLSHTSGIEATLRFTVKLLQLCFIVNIIILFLGFSLMQMRRFAGSVCLR